MTRTLTAVSAAAGLVAAVAAGTLLGRSMIPDGPETPVEPTGPALYADLRPPSPEPLGAEPTVTPS